MERSRSNTKNRESAGVGSSLDRPTTAPPAPLPTDPTLPKTIDLSDLDTSSSTLDTEGLFATSTDWSLLGKAMAVLQDQYEQCLQDIAALEVMKQEALADPETFVHRLRQDDIDIPVLQTIYRIPEIDTDRFSVRSSRRGLNKKEQNAEFILGRLRELQQRGSVVLPIPCRSDNLVIDAPLSTTKPTTSITNPHRERFLSVLDDPSRSATPSIPSLPSQQPSTASSSAPTSPLQKKAKLAPSSAHTHNVPWTREEKIKLNELLREYPEEPVAARRYAKIAAAMGTRTATQVFTRVNKLAASKRAHLADVSDTDTADTPTAAADSAEYKEYVKLKRALEQELSGAGTALVHSGISCSLCHARPIVGVRYRCVECQVDLCDVCFVPGSHHGPHRSHRVQTVPLQPIVDGTMAEYDYLNPVNKN